jgi:signal transduction histidine kinase
MDTDASMRICVVSDSEELATLFGREHAFTIMTSVPGQPVPDADLYIWDYKAGFEFRCWLSEKDEAQHFVLADPKYLDALADLQTSVCILLKPLTAFTLRVFADLARKSRQLRRRALEADSLRSDRDALLQYVLEVNLKLQEYDQERNNFLARALHDFRAPLTALHGYCGLLSEGKVGTVSATQRALLDRMQNSTKRLTRMAGGALDLLAEGRFERPPVRTPGDIGEALSQALHDVYPLLKDKGLELRIDVKPPGATLLFEAEQIQQVLVNLIENSCKFTPRQGTIEIRSYPTYYNPRLTRNLTACEQEAANAYRIDISDSGPGVPEELSDKIFEQYASYGGSVDRSVGGLGLAICRVIVTAHAGAIWVTPTRDGGRFSFVLPLCAPKLTAPEPAIVQALPARDSLISH